LVQAALSEDIGQEDVTTTATVPAGVRCITRLVAKQTGVLSGMAAFAAAFDIQGAEVQDYEAAADGTRFQAGDVLATFSGRTREVLTAERVAMNFVQHLSGVATLTAAFMAELAGLPCRMCDTRKTTPLLRALEKQAVIHGGGANHRYNLSSGVLIKENHLTAAGGIAAAVKQARAHASHMLRVEVEVTNFDELDEALAAGADIILLDNMDPETLVEAVRRTRNAPGGGTVQLEASGNVTLDRVRAIGETGVDLISSGALTHSAPAVDLSLLIENV
jgi:nicotinate-nucleotide pyrophosphorylase (carboxylating)